MTLYSRLKKAYAYSRDIQYLVDHYSFTWKTKDSSESRKIIKNALEALEDFETNYEAHPDWFEERKAELAKIDAEVEAVRAASVRSVTLAKADIIKEDAQNDSGELYAVEGYPQKDSEFPVMVCGGFSAPLTAKSNKPEIIDADKAIHYLRKTIASAIVKGGYKTGEPSQADAAREARLKYEREWRAKNKEKVKARQARYWAKKAKTTE